MDRQKYINSQDYRDGYDEGIKDCIKQRQEQNKRVGDEIKKLLLSASQDTESEE